MNAHLPSHAVVPRAASCVVLCVALAASGPASAVEIESLTSPGGIEFLLAPIPDADAVSVQVAWPSDWVYTEPSVGTPYVGADLVVQGGAGERDAAEAQQAFEDLRAEGAVLVSADVVQGALSVPAEHLDAAVALGAETLARPALDERWFERVRDGFEANIEEGRSTTDALVGRTLRRLVHGDTGLERFLSTADPGVASDVTLEDVRRWHADTFVRAGMTVAVAGGVDADAAGEAVDALLGELPEGDAPPAAPDASADFSPRTVLVHAPDADQGIVALTGRLPPTSAGGELEDVVAALALGGDEKSVLFEALRTGLRAAYSPAALIDPQTRAVRTVLLYAAVDAAGVDAARDAMLQAYAGFRKDGPDEGEIGAIAERIRHGFEQTFEDPAALAQTVLANALDGRPPARLIGIADEIDAVSAASVKARLDAAWPPADELVQVLLSPDAGAVDGACTIEDAEDASDCE